MGPARWGSRFRPGDPLGGTGGLRAVRPWRRRRSAGLRQGVPVFLFEASRAPPLRTWPTVPAVPHPGLKRSPVGQRARSRPAPVPRALRARDARMLRAGAQSRQACQWPGRSRGERADFTGQSDSGSDGSWVAPRLRRPARRPVRPSRQPASPRPASPDPPPAAPGQRRRTPLAPWRPRRPRWCSPALAHRHWRPEARGGCSPPRSAAAPGHQRLQPHGGPGPRASPLIRGTGAGAPFVDAGLAVARL